MGGLFDTFTIAKRGLSVQQGNINATSHNIANTQTEGYSRQRAVIQTTRPFGGASRFDLSRPGQIGTGAEITTIMRVRDSFLDYQVRTERTEYGTDDIRSEYLYQTEDILNETTSSGVQGALSEFYDAFQELSKHPEKSTNRTVAIAKASNVASALNSRYKQLADKKNQAQLDLGQYVSDINTKLDQINKLNKQISSISSAGMTPNDLMDSRDLLLDKLSSDFGIKITKQSSERMDLSVQEDQGIANLINSNPDNSNYTRFSYVKNAEIKNDGSSDYLEVTIDVLGNSENQKVMKITSGDIKTLQKNLMEDRILVSDKDGNVVKSTSNSVTSTAAATDKEGITSSIAADGTGTITQTTITGTTKTVTTITKTAINSASDLNDCIFNKVTKGEIAGNQKVQDSIQGYMDQLDKFAASFAYSVNAIQTASTEDGVSGMVDKDGNTVSADLIFVVKKDDGTITTTDTGINAKNITINSVFASESLTKHPELLNCGEKHVDDLSGEQDGSRALAISHIIKDLKMNIGAVKEDDIVSRKTFFKGTTASSTLGTAGIGFADAKKMELKNLNGGTGTLLPDYYGSSVVTDLATQAGKSAGDAEDGANKLKAYENTRLQVSGVSIDEEAANLIQYTHSYQANAKVISTVDELLDVVINGLKK